MSMRVEKRAAGRTGPAVAALDANQSLRSIGNSEGSPVVSARIIAYGFLVVAALLVSIAFQPARALAKGPFYLPYATGDGMPNVSRGYHCCSGWDFTMDLGTSVRAAASGTIESGNGSAQNNQFPDYSKDDKITSANCDGYTNYLTVRHDGTYKTQYLHLSPFDFESLKGKKVTAGEIIGYAGTTGCTTGPHLHFAVLKNGAYVDPGSPNCTKDLSSILWTSCPAQPASPQSSNDDARRSDFNADGKDDVAILYEYSTGAGGQAGLWYFVTNSDGNGITAWKVWLSGVGSWTWANSKVVAGDFDGDGKGDTAILYNYGPSQTGLWYFITNDKSDGVAGRRVWLSGDGSWRWANSKLVAGDFNGDGRDDVAILYDYSTGAGGQAGLWYFLTNSDGSAVSARKVWLSGVGSWTWANSTLAAGDFNGDGRDDAAILYKYGQSQTGLWYFITNDKSDGVEGRRVWLSGDGSWTWANSKVVTGDFDGDGKDDVSIFYDYSTESGGQAGLWYFLTNSDANGITARKVWLSGVGSWTWANSTLAAGDFNGDRRDDTAILYKYGQSQTGLWHFITNDKSDGVTGKKVWLSGVGSWTWSKSMLAGATP